MFASTAKTVLDTVWYYEFDETLTDSLVSVIERLRKRQELLDNARACGWSEDTLLLVLDVARQDSAC
jgi:hypothetical protein